MSQSAAPINHLRQMLIGCRTSVVTDVEMASEEVKLNTRLI
jgi:hypothetical protein